MQHPVIIVDDTPEAAEFCRSLLVEHDLPVTATFTDPRSALAYALDCKSGPLVITDYQMPRFTGVELLRRVFSRFSDAKGIIVTANVRLIGAHACGVPVIEKGTWGFCEALVGAVRKALQVTAVGG